MELYYFVQAFASILITFNPISLLLVALSTAGSHILDFFTSLVIIFEINHLSVVLLLTHSILSSRFIMEDFEKRIRGSMWFISGCYVVIGGRAVWILASNFRAMPDDSFDECLPDGSPSIILTILLLGFTGMPLAFVTHILFNAELLGDYDVLIEKREYLQLNSYCSLDLLCNVNLPSI